MEFIKKHNDIIERVGKTFIQAFVASFSIDGLMNISDADGLKKALISLLIASVASGISAVWNLIQQYVANWKEE